MNKTGPKAAIYCRSSINNDVTINIQIKRLEIYAVEHGYTFKTYVVTGTSNYRKEPAFQELLNSIDRKEIDAIIVNSLDRVSRNIEDLNYFIQCLQSQNIKLITLDSLAVDGQNE